MQAKLVILLFACLWWTAPAAAAAAPADEFIVLSYHDVRTHVKGHVDEDEYAVDTAGLTAHFAWIREHGYQPISINQILKARYDRTDLPEKAVLLTFDDGYASFHSQVYPLLKLFHYPAVVAVVGSWMDTPAGESVPYGNDTVPRERFLTWEQIREMQASGLVEVASHSYDMHRGVTGNPQGNEQPAATSRIYAGASYEADGPYWMRVADDLNRSAKQIKKHTGAWPRVMVWPYGRYNDAALAAAEKAGFTVNLGLDNRTNRAADTSPWGRILARGNPDLGEVVHDLRNPTERPVVRVSHIDLDYVYDLDPVQQERNLDVLLERIKKMRVSVVYLQAFADPDGDGGADAVYFPNRHLPVRADLFNRVAWQLMTRTGVQVYAWMPVLSFYPPAGTKGGDRFVLEVHAEGAREADWTYRRLSPFDPAARRMIGEIYEDLAKHATFDGLLFHDDALLTDREDASPAALAHYKKKWGLPGRVEEIRADPELLARWTHLKTEYLAAFTDELANRVRTYRGDLKTARNLYARVLLQPESETWLAQSFTSFLSHYDYTAIMAMPYMEGAKKPTRWLGKLVARVAAHPHAMEHTVFELQSVDWRTGQPIPADELTRQMRTLLKHGVTHFGYYPDDFTHGQPDLDTIRAAVSLRTHPHEP